MKILNFISGKDLGGPKQSFVLYNRVFELLGYDYIALIRKGAKLKELLEKNNQQYIEFSYIRSTNFLVKANSINKIKEQIEQINPSIIFVHKQIDIELTKLSLKKNIPIVGVIHGFNAKHIEYADALIAVSKKVKDFLISNGYKKPIFVVPNMVEIDKEPNLKPLSKKIKIGTMGIFRRKKGFHILIEALNLLAKKNIDFSATIAGRGKRVFVYKQMCKKYNLCSKLSFRGWISNQERDNYFDSFDIYVLPSRTESFGMVVVEAMARKKIVIATKCGGPQEIIDNGINGFLVENQNPQAIVDAIEHIVNNPNQMPKIQENAYKKAIKYDINHQKYNIKKIIDSLL